MKENKRAIWGWALYDWANSAFATTVMAGFFPVFFKQFWNSGIGANISTARLGYGNALASLAIALMAPILGAVADKKGRKKTFMLSFAYLGVFMTLGLFWVPEGRWALAIFIYAASVIGFSGANIFYDSLLPSVSPPAKTDYVSGLGFSLGYLGGGLLFLLNVLMTLYPHRFGLANSIQAVKYSFLTVALWWGFFSIITAFLVPEVKATIGNPSEGNIVAYGFRQVFSTVKKIRNMKNVFLFLVAYWLYIEGVDTIIRMAVDYGISLGFESRDLIVALLITQFIGFPSALAFGKLGQYWDTKKAILLGIGIYLCITLWGVFMHNRREFFILAVLIGLVQGGIQALSRSFYSRLIPENQAGEFFGFYNMLGKFAAILGPALVATTVLVARKIILSGDLTSQQMTQAASIASRWGISSLLILFLVGGVLLYFVEEKRTGL